jgi:peptidoglycan hydrolase FlgJ
MIGSGNILPTGMASPLPLSGNFSQAFGRQMQGLGEKNGAVEENSDLWWPPNQGVLYKGQQKLTKEKLLAQQVDAKKELSLKEKKELDQACQDFESFFTYYLLKTMDKTVPRGEGVLKDSLASKFYREMFYERLSDTISQAGIGIKDVMYDQMKETLINKVYK